MKALYRATLGAALFVTWLSAGAGAQPQDYPSRPVRVIVPYAAGGSSDIVVRLLGQKLSALWGQQLLVDNRSGAGGLIGTEAAARATADGYTLYLATDGPLTVAAAMRQGLSYDWRKDFVPISMLAVSYQMMLVSKVVPTETVAEFVALAKSKPGVLNYASIGIGSSPHLGAERFKSAAGVDLTHVPFRGSSTQAIAAMVAGDVAFFMNGTATSVPHVKSGLLRGLAVTSPTRQESVPDIPTFSELGMPSVDVMIWFAALAPAGTPDAVLRKLNADIIKVSSDPVFRKELADRGLDVKTSTPEGLRDFMERDFIKVRELVDRLGIKPD